MRVLESLADFLDLAAAVFGAVVDGGTHCDTTHVEGLTHRGEHGLVVHGRVGQRLVVVEFHHERDFVRVFSRHRTQHTHGRGDTVTTALDRKFNDILRIEVDRVRRK